MFGRLTLEALHHEGSQNIAVAMMTLTGIALVALISYLKRWKWLWNEWLTTVDHKKIGILYIIVVILSFAKGFADALMMRLQQALATRLFWSPIQKHLLFLLKWNQMYEKDRKTNRVNNIKDFYQ